MATNSSSTGTAGALPEKLTHDLNNVLASILCYATLLRRDTQGLASAVESVNEIIALAQRARQMLAHSPDRADGAELPRGKGERILLVDDDACLMTAMTRVLRGLGYQVTAFQRSTEARDVFLRDPYLYDLLLVDQTMPGVTGLDLATVALGERPSLPVVITTGNTAILDTAKVKVLGVAAVLEKPATSEVLATTLRRVLDTRG